MSLFIPIVHASWSPHLLRFCIIVGFRKCRPLWQVAHREETDLESRLDLLRRVLARALRVFPEYDTSRALFSWRLQLCSSSSRYAREKGRAANCSLLWQIRGRSLSRNLELFLSLTAACFRGDRQCANGSFVLSRSRKIYFKREDIHLCSTFEFFIT